MYLTIQGYKRPVARRSRGHPRQQCNPSFPNVPIDQDVTVLAALVAVGRHCPGGHRRGGRHLFLLDYETNVGNWNDGCIGVDSRDDCASLQSNYPNARTATIVFFAAAGVFGAVAVITALSGGDDEAKTTAHIDSCLPTLAGASNTGPNTNSATWGLACGGRF